MHFGVAAVASLWLAAGTPLRMTADLDGDGVVETATIAGAGIHRELEIRVATGALLAHAVFPGTPSSVIALRTGSLASAGALLEIVASDGATECRSVWRFRDRALSRLPILTRAGPLPDCSAAQWSYRWEQPNPDAPAVYLRERTRTLESGEHRQVEVFRFRGFELSLDTASSSAQIRGVAIPIWNDARLYSKTDLEGLYARWDLKALKKSPRLTIAADRDDGVFELRFHAPSTDESVVPICAAARGGEPDEVALTAEAGERTVRARVALAGNGGVPVEVAVEGAGPPFDGLYAPVMTRGERALQVYPSAEDELAVDAIAGTWSAGSGDALAVLLVSAYPARLRFGTANVRLSIDDAPDGVDALLVPEDGSPPTAGLLLRGADSMSRIRVSCDAGKPLSACRAQGAAEPLRRVGSRINKP